MNFHESMTSMTYEAMTGYKKRRHNSTCNHRKNRFFACVEVVWINENSHLGEHTALHSASLPEMNFWIKRD